MSMAFIDPFDGRLKFSKGEASGEKKTQGFILNPGQTSVTLEAAPFPSTVEVHWRGLFLAQGAGFDYTVTGNILNFDPTLSMRFKTGDLLTVTYWA